MKYVIKVIFTFLTLHAYKLYEHNVTLHEQQIAVNQLDNDSSYMVSRFFAEGTSGYIGILALIVIIIIWHKDVIKLIKWGCSHAKK